MRPKAPSTFLLRTKAARNDNKGRSKANPRALCAQTLRFPHFSRPLLCLIIVSTDINNLHDH
jgi:hypothetical protein